MTGKQFREKRTALGYSKRPLIAQEIGVSTESVKKWELGKVPVPKYAQRALFRLEQTLSK